jgi:hypothetical protein
VWIEDHLSYDNARIPEVLIRVGQRLDDADLLRDGATMLHWLESVCRQGRHYRFPGNRGLTDPREINWSGDEQPLEASAMADAHEAWYSSATTGWVSHWSTSPLERDATGSAPTV